MGIGDDIAGLAMPTAIEPIPVVNAEVAFTPAVVIGEVDQASLDEFCPGGMHDNKRQEQYITRPLAFGNKQAAILAAHAIVEKPVYHDM